MAYTYTNLALQRLVLNRLIEGDTLTVEELIGYLEPPAVDPAMLHAAISDLREAALVRQDGPHVQATGTAMHMAMLRLDAVPPEVLV